MNLSVHLVTDLACASPAPRCPAGYAKGSADQILERDTGARMKVRGLVLVAVGAVLFLGYGAVCGAEQSPQPTISLPPDLARILTDYEEAWQAKDEKALAALFAEDGFVLFEWYAAGQGQETDRTTLQG